MITESYTNKETQTLIEFLKQKEHWHEKRNAFLQVIGLSFFDLKPKNEPIQAHGLTFMPETEQIYKNIEDKLKRIKQAQGQCPTGKCDL